jgi:transcriptional regulator with XRE-family HTH domain
MNQILFDVGKNIKKYRQLKKLTQETLADLAGLHRTYIGAIERGERNVSVINIAKIADALNIEPFHLLRKPKK